MGIEVPMLFFPCPALGGLVELSPERERHILDRHPELATGLHGWIARTLARPDAIRRSRRSEQARLFVRGYPLELRGRHVVVVVLGALDERRWIVTAYVTRKPQGGPP